LPEVLEKLRLVDFVRLRFLIGCQQHLLQSVRLARNNDLPKKLVHESSPDRHE
jgi:hypothetical protein